MVYNDPGPGSLKRKRGRRRADKAPIAAKLQLDDTLTGDAVHVSGDLLDDLHPGCMCSMLARVVLGRLFFTDLQYEQSSARTDLFTLPLVFGDQVDWSAHLPLSGPSSHANVLPTETSRQSTP